LDYWEEQETLSKDIKYEFFIDNTSKDDFVATVLYDFTGEIIDFNQKICEITGYSKKELLQMNIFTIKHDINPKIEHIPVMLQSSREKTLRNHLGCLTHKDGKKIFVGAKNYLVESKGQKINLSLIFDITDYLKKEKELKESEVKYKTLFNSNPAYSVFLNPDGDILEMNKAVKKDLGTNLSQIKQMSMEGLGIIYPQSPKTKKKMINQIIKNSEKEPILGRLIYQNNEIHYYYCYLLPLIVDQNLIGYQGIGRDITALKKIENELKASLQEKELLVREIHHRVKNNMQIMSSLLNLATHHVKEEETITILKESQNRIKSMSMIHENLYQSKNLTHIHIHDYILRLVNDLFYTYNIQKDQIDLVTEIDDIKLNLETAIPCGLIICELITNSLKYAFPQGQKGKVEITLKIIEDTIHLTISDNGIGLPNKDYLDNDTLGFQIVHSLTNQLDSKLELDLSQGTQFKISFKELKYKKRT